MPYLPACVVTLSLTLTVSLLRGMTSECHVCGGEENLNYVCPGIQCERAFCDDCLADLCPRVGKSRW